MRDPFLIGQSFKKIDGSVTQCQFDKFPAGTVASIEPKVGTVGGWLMKAAGRSVRKFVPYKIRVNDFRAGVSDFQNKSLRIDRRDDVTATDIQQRDVQAFEKFRKS